MVAQASALVRYVILARILGPEQLGLAAMLVLTAQFFESISDTGADRFVVQDPDGDKPQMLGVVHLAMALRGLAIAAGIFVTAGLVSRLYGAPMIAPALQVLAIAPLISGFLNLDMRRAQRGDDFRPESYVTIFGEVASVAVSAAAAFIVRDHTAVLYGLIARAMVMVATSHIVSRQSYGWAFGWPEARRFSSFAGPLAINGLFLYFGSQGDRLIVANGLGAAALGEYSAILLLIFNPTSAVARFVMNMHLPPISKLRDDDAALRARGDTLGGQNLLLAVGAMAGFAAVGPLIAPVLYGPLGVQPYTTFAFLGVVQAARLLRCWPTTMALALGRSGEVMTNNIVRVVALPLAVLANQHWPSLAAILGAFYLGELLALGGALWMLMRTSTIRIRCSLRRTGMFIASSVAICAAAYLAEHSNAPVIAGAVIIAAGLLVAILVQERATVLATWTAVRAWVAARRARG